MKHTRTVFTALLGAALLALPAVAQDTAPKTDTVPKTGETFEIDGHKAFVYAAPKPARARAPEVPKR